MEHTPVIDGDWVRWHGPFGKLSRDLVESLCGAATELPKYLLVRGESCTLRFEKTRRSNDPRRWIEDGYYTANLPDNQTARIDFAIEIEPSRPRRLLESAKALQRVP